MATPAAPAASDMLWAEALMPRRPGRGHGVPLLGMPWCCLALVFKP